jgi:hypothetical protein
MTVAEKITLWLAQVRAAGRSVLLMRLVIAVAGAVALIVPSVQAWDQVDLIPILGVPMLAATVVLPDSVLGTLFVLVVPTGWFMRGPGEVSWSLAVTAIALVIVHLATAFTAQLPSYARIHRNALQRWWLPGAVAVVLVPVVAVAAALVQGAHLPGTLLITVAALSLATLTIWYAAGQKPTS